MALIENRIRTFIDCTPSGFKTWATFTKEYDFNAREVDHATHGRRRVDGALQTAMLSFAWLALKMGHRWTPDGVRQGKPHSFQHLVGAIKCGIDLKLNKSMRLVVEDTSSGSALWPCRKRNRACGVDSEIKEPYRRHYRYVGVSELAKQSEERPLRACVGDRRSWFADWAPSRRGMLLGSEARTWWWEGARKRSARESVEISH
ncbi:hypothetical protein BV22DRAFT_1043971 [Leucogyrophana mollusca]|uniref:Uncharacterized protein n=1 Tax=Leucogyrophana mollusca TaxID=85980 RepID=A0ACB8BWY3_9AGAM|nr:hypothetical protein BV22DRAFT_1043971 [Leucogyrophana mollusca]